MNTEPEKSKPLAYGLGFLILMGCLVAFFSLDTFRTRGPHPGKEEFSNARLIGLLLSEFDSDYGSYPNEATAPLVTASYPAHGYDLSGTSSNALFRQLFVAQITQSEQMFYARNNGSMKPDDDLTPGNLLAPGECDFSYILGLSSEDDPATPIVLTPLIPSTTKFDPKPFDGKAIILFTDNSARTFEIHEDGHIYEDGINLLSPEHPFWNGKPPDIRYPEL